jgi:hypothetical protein
MNRRAATRVVVGIDDSMAGFRALRLAVDEARRRDAVLHALRAWTFSPSGRGAYTGSYAQSAQLAAAAIVAAFAGTMGGPARGHGSGDPPRPVASHRVTRAA